MCGIAGIFDLKSNREINRKDLTRMRDSLIHRGPDEAGVFYDPGVGLAHRRLSIIDLSSGQQPLFNQDKSVVIVFNGEIYNYRELGEKLKNKGYRFSTKSDTEVIVHAWEEWKEDCVKHLRGMFAFTIWDKNEDKLFIARDRLGIKPLVYAVTRSGYFVFASEIKSLLEHPDIDKEICPKAVDSYFAFGYVPDPASIYKNIKKLEPGCTLSIGKDRSLSFNRYWDLSVKNSYHEGLEESQSRLIELLDESIKIRLISEVPLGAFLSGGVDSSAIVARMSEIDNDRVHTCSIGFESDEFDESKYANEISKRYNTRHHVDIVKNDGHVLLDNLINIYDEPFADNSALPTLRVCETARKYVTVALSGDGADELFAGYRRHEWHMREEAIRSRMPHSLRSALFGPLGNIYPKADWAPSVFRAKTTLQALSRNPVEAYLETVSSNSGETRSSLYSNRFQNDLVGFNPVQIFENYAENVPDADALQLIQYLDLKTYIPGDILTKVDKASMAHSLEVRVPFLDHKVVEWGFNLPPEYKLQGSTGKRILKQAMKKNIPDNILYRKKKGFGVPMKEWTRGPLKNEVEDVLKGSRLNDSGYFDSNYLDKIRHEHSNSTRDHSSVIWSLLVFDKFIAKAA